MAESSRTFGSGGWTGGVRLPTELRLLHAIEVATGRKFSEAERQSFVKVTDELAIVNSGLEARMIVAYQDIREALRRRPEMGDLRTAAFVTAINKVAIVYEELGFFHKLSPRRSQSSQRNFSRKTSVCSVFSVVKIYFERRDTSTRASLKQAPPPKSVSESGTSAFAVI